MRTGAVDGQYMVRHRDRDGWFTVWAYTKDSVSLGKFGGWKQIENG
jgi:hypothetical protein